MNPGGKVVGNPSRALGALVVSAVAVAAALTAAAPPAQAAPRPNPLVKVHSGRLDAHDRQLLDQARQAHRPDTTVILMARPGQGADLEHQVERLGGVVRTAARRIGYVRASVPTTAVEEVAALSALRALDLDETFRLPQPEPSSPGVTAEAARTGPGSDTPAANPYLPTDDTDSVRFKRQHPEWDGRGVTIGVVDSGVSLDNPALQVTSTGERKIVDWVTGTDPVDDEDGTWRPMRTAVTGPSFSADGTTWTSPAGSWLFNSFDEAITKDDQLAGDVDRDGDTTDRFGILYDPVNHDIRVDSDQDHDFTDNPVMRPYREKFDVGHFGTDRPDTPVRDQVPFVVQYREDVNTAPAGEPADPVDFVNIGITEDEHGSHVAGIAAGADMFGNADYDGQAPGAKIVSSRACSWGGGCTAAALADGVVDLVLDHQVDVVNISIGGLPALNDGDNARAFLYNLLIDDFGVQFFISAGNSGPGLNTVGDPSVASSAVSVAASVSRETWLSNYGSVTSAKMGMFPFSSRGPREDGGFKPDLTAPGAAISTIDQWLPGAPVKEAGYPLPPGYAMLQGTSMAAPEATGAAALLLSAARAEDVPVTSRSLRQSMKTSANFLKDVPAADQGSGLIDVRDAWKVLRGNPEVRSYTSSAPVCTIYSGFLAEKDRGEGIYNRCGSADGGQPAGTAKTYTVTLSRLSGPAGPVVHALKWVGNDGTFSAPAEVTLPLGAPVTVTVTAKPVADGAHSAILQVDDPATALVDHQMLNTVVVARHLEGPAYRFTASGKQERNATRSYFLDVPAGGAALQVDLSGISAGSQVRWIAIPPSGVPAENTSTPFCYPNYDDPANPNHCPPLSRSYANPAPGVWEFEVEARRTSPLLKNPYSLTARLLGVTVTPKTVTVPSATVGTPVAVEWQVHNEFGPVTLHGEGGPLGSAVRSRPVIAQGKQQVRSVTVPAGASRFEASIGAPSDPGADLDLYVFRNGALIAQSADGDAEESVTLTNPAPGFYQMLIDGYAVPAGSTEYDYSDAYFAVDLGSLDVPATTHALIQGQSAPLTGTLTAKVAPAGGRQVFGRLDVVSDQGAVVGSGTVVVSAVTNAQ
jgi:subtilisin family serine protease